MVGSPNTTAKFLFVNTSFSEAFKNRVYKTVECPIAIPIIIIFFRDGRTVKLLYDRDFNCNFIFWEDIGAELNQIAYRHENEECRIILSLGRQ